MNFSEHDRQPKDKERGKRFRINLNLLRTVIPVYSSLGYGEYLLIVNDLLYNKYWTIETNAKDTDIMNPLIVNTFHITDSMKSIRL